jgi:flagellar biosynthesis/type III secretory pathway protein FliH
MTLALRHIDAELLHHADGVNGVIKAAAVASVDGARDVIARAQQEADRLLDEAQARARHDLQRHRDDLEAQLWQSAADYAQSLQAEWDQALVKLEDRMVGMLGHAMRHLINEIPPEERLRACVKQLVNEAETPDAGVLLMNTSLQATVHSLNADSLPWPVEFSDELPEGAVRLVATQGRWECAFDTSIERLVQALGNRPDNRQERTDAH